MSNDKKETAVEWLIEQMTELESTKKERSLSLHLDLLEECFEQADAMFEEQIKNAYQSDRFPCSEEDAEQYYNETYKQP
jgi:hypothetical protein